VSIKDTIDEFEKSQKYFEELGQKIQLAPELQDSINKLSRDNDNLRQETENIKKDFENKYRALNDVATDQNKLIEQSLIQLEAFKNRIRELEKDNEHLNEFKEQVWDSGGIDCSNTHLEPGPCIMGLCNT
jgi:predicted RNase H-like nuclease (RuvC/YqgF family)